MPVSEVLVPCDDGRLWIATVLDQVRDRRNGSRRVVARYSTGRGKTYIRADRGDRADRADR